MHSSEVLERLLKKERLARKEAEELLEVKSLQLYQANEALLAFAGDLEQRVKERTQELELQQQALEAVAEEAKSADRAKTTFLANMSHEIRTPLNGIIGMHRLMQLEPLTQRQAEYADSIGTSAESLLRIINEILDVSRMDAGQVEIEEKDFSLVSVLDAVAEILETRALDNETDLTIQYDPLAPPVLRGDALRLQQILLNVVGNAVKFSPKGTACVKVQSTAFEPGRCRIDFHIEDTGIGMSEDELATVMEPFVQADSSISRRFGGTGLGLSISKRLIALLGGELAIESEKGVGSSFRISLPFGISKPVEASGLALRASLAGVVATSVLDAHRESFGSMLELEGFIAEQTASVEEGLKAGQRLARDGKVLWFLSCGGLSDQGIMDAASKLKGLPESILPILFVPGNKDYLREQLGDLHVMRFPVSRRVIMRRLSTILGCSSFQTISNERPEAGQRLENLTVLLAEDDRINREVGRATLEHHGATVDVARDGVEAMEKVGNGSYDLILLDIRMPMMDGVQTCRRIRELNISTPVVALTADAMPGDEQRFIEAGMSAYLSKPLMEEDLFNVLSGLGGDGKWEIAPIAPVADSDDIPVLDIRSFLTTLGGDVEVARSLLEDFSGWGRNLLTVGSERLQAEQAEEAIAVYHQLSGAAYSVQALQVGSIALTIERLLKEHEADISEVQLVARKLDEAYNNYLEEFTATNWEELKK